MGFQIESQVVIRQIRSNHGRAYLLAIIYTRTVRLIIYT